MRAEGFRLFDLAFGGILYMYMYMCMCMYMYMYMFMYMYMDMDADLDMYHVYVYVYVHLWMDYTRILVPVFRTSTLFRAVVFWVSKFVIDGPRLGGFS